MLRRTLSRINRVLGRAFVNTPLVRTPDRASAGKKSHLALESLEAREVPANLLWVNKGGDHMFANPLNWIDTSAGTFSPTPPAPGDSLTFDGSVTSDDLIDLHGFGLPDSVADFTAVNLINGYGGTVTLAPDPSGGISVGTFTLSAAPTGAIAQPIAGATDLSVLGNFTWTSGTLNSTPSLANVNLFDNGSIAPANAGTLLLGSNLILTGTQPAPKTVIQAPGQLTITNAGVNVIVGVYANLTAATSTTGDVIKINKNQAGSEAIDIRENGTLNCIGPGRIEYDVYMRNQGTFNLTGSVRVTMTGNVSQPMPPRSYGQAPTGSLRLENGVSLTATHGFDISGGIVFIYMNPLLTSSQQTATVNGTWTMSDGMIFFGIPIALGTTLTYGTFTINGNVNWAGGSYKPSVDYTNAGLANKWIVNGTMTSAVACVVDPNPQLGAIPPAASNWDVLDATAVAGNLPSVIAGSPLTLGQFNVAGRKVWKLTS